MPKKIIVFDTPVNIKMAKEMVEFLQAVGYWRGNGGQYADPVRDFCQQGIDQFMTGLSPADRRRFDEILESVRMAGSMKG